MKLSHSGVITVAEWEKTGSHREGVELDEFGVMPNHIHGIITLNTVVGTPFGSAIQMLSLASLRALMRRLDALRLSDTDVELSVPTSVDEIGSPSARPNEH